LRANIRLILIALGIGLPILTLFQNCQGPFKPSTLKVQTKANGGGESYGGKLSLQLFPAGLYLTDTPIQKLAPEYYRFLNGHTCSAETFSHAGLISLFNTSASYSADSCSSPTPLTEELKLAAYNPNLLVYQNGIFEASSEQFGPFSSQPSAHNVALCRFAHGASEGMDIVVKKYSRKLERVLATPSTIDFSVCDRLPAGVHLERATRASFHGADGRIHEAEPNGPRCDYDPVTGEMRGWLVEASSRNLLPYSNDFSKKPWGGTASLARKDTAPDGGTAWLVADESTESKQVLTSWQAGAVRDDNSKYTFSIYAKKADAPEFSFNLGFFGGEDKSCWQFVRWTDDGPRWSKGSTSTLNRGFKPLKNGWYRFWVTCSNNSLGNTTLRAILSPVGDADNRGDDIGSTLFWGAQVEASDFPSSYIPTQSSAMSRAGDQLLIAALPAATTSLTVLVRWAPVLPASGGELLGITDSSGNRLGLNGNVAAGLRTSLYRMEDTEPKQATAMGEMWRDEHMITSAMTISPHEAIVYEEGREASRMTLPSQSGMFTAISMAQGTLHGMQAHLQTIQYWNQSFTTGQLASITDPGTSTTPYRLTVLQGRKYENEDSETLHFRKESAQLEMQSKITKGSIEFQSGQKDLRLQIFDGTSETSGSVSGRLNAIIDGNHLDLTGECTVERENY
jgi:hypothetical protein